MKKRTKFYLLIVLGILGLTVIVYLAKSQFKSRSLWLIPPEIKREGEISSQAETNLFFVPETTEVQVGGVFPLLIGVDSKQNTLTGVELVFKFDPEYLQVVDIIPSDYFQSATVLDQKVNNTAGVVSFVILCPPTQPRQGEGNLALINFKAKKRTVNNPTLVEFLPRTRVAALSEEKNVLRTVGKATVKIED